MIIDVHRHMVIKGTVQGDYIRGAQKSFAMMYRKTHNLDITDRNSRTMLSGSTSTRPGTKS
jgi:hypothetical protein